MDGDAWDEAGVRKMMAKVVEEGIVGVGIAGFGVVASGGGICSSNSSSSSSSSSSSNVFFGKGNGSGTLSVWRRDCSY